MNHHTSLVRHSLIAEGILNIFLSHHGKDWYSKASSTGSRRIYHVLLGTLLYIEERNDLNDYIACLRVLAPEDLKLLLLDAGYDAYEVDNLKNEDIIADLIDLIDEGVKGIKTIYNDHVNELETMCKQMSKELENRHPLSYAQGLMGKSFYNIADYDYYEFIPVTSGPFKMLRVMNHSKNILLYNINMTNEALEETRARLSHGMKLLADPKRLEIMRLIYHSPMCGKDIANTMNLTTATVSHHMDLLRKAGFLHVERDQNTKYFSINYHGVMGLSRDMQAYILNRK